MAESAQAKTSDTPPNSDTSINAACTDLIGCIHGFAQQYGEHVLHVLPLPTEAASDLASMLARCRRLSELLEDNG
jgi:hypothetical protein